MKRLFAAAMRRISTAGSRRQPWCSCSGTISRCARCWEPIHAATSMLRQFASKSAFAVQHGIAATNEPIRWNKQFYLHRPCILDPGRNEVVQLIVVAKSPRSAIG